MTTFMKVTLPLVWTGFVSRVILGFARGIGESGATIDMREIRTSLHSAS